MWPFDDEPAPAQAVATPAPAPGLSPDQAQALFSKNLISDQTFQKAVPAPAPVAMPTLGGGDKSTDLTGGFIAAAQDRKKAQDEAKKNEDLDMAARQAGLLKETLQYRINRDVEDGVDPAEIQKKYASDIARIGEFEKKAQPAGGVQQTALNRSDVTAPVLASDVQNTAALRNGAPQAAPDYNTLLGPMTAGYDMQQAALKQAAGVGYAKGAEEAAAIEQMSKANQQRIESQETADRERQANLDERFKKVEAAANELGSLKVDPDRYWANKDSGDKILAGIGLALGAFGSGGNKAAAIINDAIDRDIKTQAMNIDTKKAAYTAQSGLLNDMMQRFKDRRVAEDATRIAYLDNAKLNVQRIAAKHSGGEVAAKSALLIGEIEQKKIETKMALMQHMMKNQPTIDGNVNVNALDKDQRERYVPGYGLSLSKDDATKFKEALFNTNSAKEGIGQLLGIANVEGKSMDTQLRAKAQSIASLLQGSLRSEVLGPGAVTESEREMLQEIIANPTDVLARDSTVKTRLQTLAQRLDVNLASKAQAFGLTTSAQKLGITPVGGK